MTSNVAVDKGYEMGVNSSQSINVIYEKLKKIPVVFAVPDLALCTHELPLNLIFHIQVCAIKCGSLVTYFCTVKVST